jgi:hypothetical protein
MTSGDLTGQLRAARPVAPEALRVRVRELAASGAAPAGRLPSLRLPRLRLVLPLAVATAVAAAALVAAVHPEHRVSREAATPSPSGTVTTRLGRVGPPPATSAGGSARAQDHAAAAATTAPSPTSGRAQDYQAQIGLEVKDDAALSEATRRAMTIARSLGGYVVAAQYASGSTGTAALTLRVPTDRVQDAITQLTALGRITSQQVQIQDLQVELDRLDRQIATLRDRVAHVTSLLADPELTSERRAELEEQRTRLQNVLRAVRQQRGATATRAALATIELTLAAREQSTTPAPASRWRRRLDEAARILTWEGVAFLYGVVVVVPFALLGGFGWLGVRARRRGSERQFLART